MVCKYLVQMKKGTTEAAEPGLKKEIWKVWPPSENDTYGSYVQCCLQVKLILLFSPSGVEKRTVKQTIQASNFLVYFHYDLLSITPSVPKSLNICHSLVSNICRFLVQNYTKERQTFGDGWSTILSILQLEKAKCVPVKNSGAPFLRSEF
jgi:hypothetical protein